MKTVGIIGGLSPESTIKYYQWLNQGVNEKLGGHHNAKILLHSLDFGEFVKLKSQGGWDSQAQLLVQAALSLEKAGADFIILATNTMHKMADEIEAALYIPFLHLADATADEICSQNLKKIGLLGTKFTMEMTFYKERLQKKGLEVLVPNAEGRDIVNTIIYDELCHGVVKPASKQAYQAQIKYLEQQGVEAIILGCTEITMLVDSKDATVPLFDTTRIHVNKSLEFLF